MATRTDAHDRIRPPTTSRRRAVRLGLAVLATVPSYAGRTRRAFSEEATASALAAAQEEYLAVEGRIDELARQYEQAGIELADTMEALEVKQGEIDRTRVGIDFTRVQIEATRADLAEAQDQLADVMAANYKSGKTTALDVVMQSADYDELFENLYYLNKVSDEEARLIGRAKDMKALLEEQEASLESQLATLQDQYAEIDDLRGVQEWQLAQMRERQDEAYALLSSLDEQVRALTEQYNAELIAQAEAAAAAAARSSGGDAGEAFGSTSSAAVVSACGYTPSPGAGWCAAWVTDVFVNAGVGYFGGDACDMYASWCYDSDQATIRTGMIVAVSTWSGTSAGRIYGHVGVYVGGGMVMDNIGYIRTIDLGSWVATYGTTVTPRWGWIGGVALS